MARRVETPTLPVAEFRRLDLNAEELGVPVSRLMARAGKALASAVQARMGKGGAVFFCGKGNNGGDGLAAAYLLSQAGRDVSVVLAEPPERTRHEASRLYLDLVPKDRIMVWKGRAHPSWKSAAVHVDCLLGSGLKGDPRAPYDALLRYLRRSRVPVVSCDIPSGLGTKLSVSPVETVTFHAAKQGMTRANSGRIRVVDIGIPKDAAATIGLGDLVTSYPVPQADSHKGDNGVVLVVAGGPYVGAPQYAGMAAYRTGADLVHACMPEDAARVVAGYGPHILVHPTEPGSTPTPLGMPVVLEWMERAGAVVLGPGLGTAATTREFAGQVLVEAARRGLPVVVDADGLDAVTPELLERHGHRMVLTPHGKEFLDLAGAKATERSVQDYAGRHGVTVLWKRQGTFVTDGHRHRTSRRGHSTMTVGGTGDVLAGCVGALLAKGAQPFEAACVASYLVGCAGEIAGALRSWGATATDVLEAIPAVLLRLERS